MKSHARSRKSSPWHDALALGTGIFVGVLATWKVYDLTIWWLSNRP